MKRLLPREDLLKLIQLVEEANKEEYLDLLKYLRTAYKNKWGDGSLYAINWSGAVALQLLNSTFEGKFSLD
jgi:hypothetical protein